LEVHLFSFLLLLLLFFISLCCCASFSLETAKNTIFLAYASYCGTRVDQNFNCYWCNYSPGFSWVGNFGDTKSPYFGFVGYHSRNRTIFVVFRGTDNIRGWIADFTFLKTNYENVNGAEVHTGIYKAYLNVKDQIKSLYIKALSACYTCDNIIVTGHSLGAGLAIFSALDMRYYVNRTMTVYNYGSPRLGNQVFSDYASKAISIWRITKDRDPVPHIPLKLMKYYHVSSEIFFRNGAYKGCNGAEDPNCADSIKITNPIDHGLYMDVSIYEGIPRGCLYTDPQSLEEFKMMNEDRE